MRQMIRVDALGRPMGEYREDSPVALSVLGDQSIARFSIIHHHEKSQRFYIEFMERAPRRLTGHRATGAHVRDLCPAHDAESETAWIDHGPMCDAEPVASFASYAAAVAAERAMIATLMMRGELHG